MRPADDHRQWWQGGARVELPVSRREGAPATPCDMGHTHRDLRAAIARSVRETRLAIGWSQDQLGRRANLSGSMVGKAERAEGDLSLATTAALFDALGIQASLDLRAPFLADRQRQLEPAHARCVAYAQRRYERVGWLTAREVEISHGRSHGWIDLLAFDPQSGALVVNEIKTEIEDEGRIERTMGWYERAAWEVARNLGWRPRFVVGCLLLLDTERNHERIRGNREAFATGFPVRASALTSWLGDPRRPWPAPARALALVDPLSRREAWLRATTSDGRRTPAPYEDYADFMRRLRGRR